MLLPMLLLAFFASASLAAPASEFSTSVYPVLEKAACRGCHNPEGVASPTRLHFPEPEVAMERVEAFGQSLVEFVDRATPQKSLLLLKPTARIAHAGGERIQPGSADEKVLQAWVEKLAALKGPELAAALRYREEEDSGGGADRPLVALRRLTHSQYNNTVRDLLGNRSLPARQFPPEDFVNGFKNQFVAQNLSPVLANAYSAAAEKLARDAFRNGLPVALVACKPSVACRSQFIQSFGKKAFRRPLEASEVARYAGLFRKQANFAAGAQLVVEAMLQSPNFLFRMEDTVDPKLKSYAAASRLAYSLWDTMPDDALMAKAARGELDTPAGVEKTAREMLQDPRAKEALDEFVSQWLRFDRVLTATKERRAFPLFTFETAVAMTGEARRFVADLVWGKRDFTQLFTADYGYMNGDLARIYNVSNVGSDFERMPFPADSERAGLLGQAMFLAITAKPDETSPTARGLFVREQFLCQKVADPPPGTNTTLPPVNKTKPMTNRERISEHVTNKSCAGCHNLVDPIGFGFEKFDAIGQRREKLKLTFREGSGEGENARRQTSTTELELDTTGQVAGLPNSKFSSPKQLGAVLASSRDCQECIVKQYFRYVYGRAETPADRPHIREAFERFRKSGFQFQELMIAMMNREPAEGGPSHVQRNH